MRQPSNRISSRLIGLLRIVTLSVSWTPPGRQPATATVTLTVARSFADPLPSEHTTRKNVNKNNGPLISEKTKKCLLMGHFLTLAAADVSDQSKVEKALRLVEEMSESELREVTF
jgi:hypothetical protein